MTRVRDTDRDKTHDPQGVIYFVEDGSPSAVPSPRPVPCYHLISSPGRTLRFLFRLLGSLPTPGTPPGDTICPATLVSWVGLLGPSPRCTPVPPREDVSLVVHTPGAPGAANRAHDLGRPAPPSAKSLSISDSRLPVPPHGTSPPLSVPQETGHGTRAPRAHTSPPPFRRPKTPPRPPSRVSESTGVYPVFSPPSCFSSVPPEVPNAGFSDFLPQR